MLLDRSCSQSQRCQKPLHWHKALPLLAVGTTTVSPMSMVHGMLQFFMVLVEVSDFLFFPAFDTASGIGGKSFFIQLVDFFVVSI